jgi:tRNA(Glu) U13 pseudouridine synthase TruD
VEAGWRRPLQPGESQGNAFRLRVRGVRPADAAAPAAAGSTDDDGRGEATAAAVAEAAACVRRELEERLRAVQAHGFIDYYGRQRLAAPAAAGGSGGPCAWEVGRALLRQDWEGLLRLLFGPREGDWEVSGDLGEEREQHGWKARSDTV